MRIDDDFNVHENFLGFYRAQSMAVTDLSRQIEDVLQRLNLPLITRLIEIGLSESLAFDGGH